MADSAAMLCPVCRVPLTMSERQNIEIDFCPQCRGVWLDRGELDKIIERSAPAPTAAAAPSRPAEPQQPYPQAQPYHGGGYGYDHGKPYKKRRKSFLEELFD